MSVPVARVGTLFGFGFGQLRLPELVTRAFCLPAGRIEVAPQGMQQAQYIICFYVVSLRLAAPRAPATSTTTQRQQLLPHALHSPHKPRCSCSVALHTQHSGQDALVGCARRPCRLVVRAQPVLQPAAAAAAPTAPAPPSLTPRRCSLIWRSCVKTSAGRRHPRCARGCSTAARRRDECAPLTHKRTSPRALFQPRTPLPTRAEAGVRR